MKQNVRSAGLVLALAGLLVAGSLARAADPAQNLEQSYAAHEVRLDTRMSEFHQELQITMTQEALWKTYASAVRHNLQDAHDQTVLEIQHAPATAPDHFEHLLALKREQLNSLRQIASSFNALYVALSPVQKRVADEHFAKMRAAMLKRVEGR